MWVELLRPAEWIELHGAKVGGTVPLELHEMGAAGDAEVLSLGPCPKIQPGRDTIVTGTFRHQADENSNVVRLELEDQLELTGVTDNHAYWSVDRQTFIDVGSLRPDELIDTQYGLKHVVSVTPIDYHDFLYNLETTEHVYRVGSLGTLVHNECTKFGAKRPKVGAKRGPKTDPNAPHNATIRAQGELLEAGGNRLIAGGGKLKEQLVPTPGGIRGGRRPDILFETPSGQIRGRNIGKTTAAGDPIKREVEALRDLNGPGGIPTDFVPYD